MDYLNTKIDKYFEKYNVNPDPTTPGYFAGAVKIALHEYNLPVSEFANEFGVPDSTVRRWASGVARPHQKLRENILKYINEKIK
ncbi:MAG: hypothetical protein AABX31_05560 [Nanoarchaeota archaeon]